VNADYSSSTVDGFPAAVTGSGSVDFDSWIMNEPTLLGDSDHAGGFSVNRSGFWSFGPSNLYPPEDRPGKGGSHCSSDGSTTGVSQCEKKEELSSLSTTSSGAGSDGGYQPAQQIPNFPGSNPPVGGAYPLRLEMMPAQNSFAMTWPSGAIQGTLPLACDACDVTPPVVDDAFAPASDFVNLNGPTTDPLFGGTLGDLGVTPATSIPEIPPTAMLLIGFAGLALVGRRRLGGQCVSDSIVPSQDKLDAALNDVGQLQSC
jgi:hypothetical protein